MTQTKDLKRLKTTLAILALGLVIVITLVISREVLRNQAINYIGRKNIEVSIKKNSPSPSPSENVKLPLKDYVLKLCKYIPDHWLNPQSKRYMTDDFFSALYKAWEYDIQHTEEGYIGPGEWLHYFVTGNGGTRPYFRVLSISSVSPNESVAMIGVLDLWEDETMPRIDAEQRVYKMKLKYEKGQWLIDDFNGKKRKCKLFIQGKL